MVQQELERHSAITQFAINCKVIIKLCSVLLHLELQLYYFKEDVLLILHSNPSRCVGVYSCVVLMDLVYMPDFC